MTHTRSAALGLACALLGLMSASAQEAPAAKSAAPPQRYTFSYPLSDDPSLAPRGGTTRGPAVEVDTEPSAAWRALQEANLSPKERDRRAILAMAGGYRVTFDFLEIVDFRPEPTLGKPYQSWGTEYVYVAADRGNFISLQHLLVMRIIDKEGKVTDPFVTKHWRQDWSYEEPVMVEYAGQNTWKRRKLARKAVAGTWAQSVYQVDDSPRYESYGRWVHTPGQSTWISGETWRPLPRREWTVRKDYDVLIGTNRHTIVAGGWVQEENNLKGVTDGQSKLRASLPYVGREYGVARYQRIRNYDFSAGDQYFEKTRSFWADVRSAWDKRFEASPSITLTQQVDQGQLFIPLFEYADSLVDAEKSEDRAEEAALIDRTLTSMIRQ